MGTETDKVIETGQAAETEKAGRKKLFMKWAKRIFLILVAVFLIR